MDPVSLSDSYRRDGLIRSFDVLNDDEVQSMVDDAAAHEEADKKKRDIIQERNNLDTLIYQGQKTYDEHASKISNESSKNIEENLETAKIALDSDDLDKMYDQANEIDSWGKSIFVKIPITNSKGEKTSGLIKKLLE